MINNRSYLIAQLRGFTKANPGMEYMLSTNIYWVVFHVNHSPCPPDLRRGRQEAFRTVWQVLLVLHGAAKESGGRTKESREDVVNQ